MFNATAIPQGDVVLLTGTTAIGVVFAVREKCTEQAMLHVKQRHVLMKGDLQQRWMNGGGQIQQLLKVQVVTGRKSLQRPMVAIPVETQGVGGVEGKSPMQGASGVSTSS